MLVPISGGLVSRGGGGEVGGEAIDLLSCQEVVQAELGRLERELKKRAARLDWRSRR